MINIIVAVSQNGVIGKDGKIPWNLKEDLKHFQKVTTGHIIIMGRKTFESLPKVLPNRHHIVITRDKEYIVDNKDVEVVNSINEIIEKYKYSKEEIFVIGGSQIYKEFISHVNKAYVTVIFKDFNGDVRFNYKDFDTIMKKWNVINSTPVWNSSKGFSYNFIEFQNPELLNNK